MEGQNLLNCVEDILRTGRSCIWQLGTKLFTILNNRNIVF